MFTLIVPYYRNVAMLNRQAAEWCAYPEDIKIIVVDDGSPEAAVEHCQFPKGVQVYRINEDIPWNRNGARNLGAHVATTDWIVQVDIDHLLPAPCASRLAAAQISSREWWQFPRFRRGKADATRNKDDLPRDAQYGPIHPHCDSYVMYRAGYWSIGGYDERYAGCLGGGGVFLKRARKLLGGPALLPDDMYLEVFTRSEIKDASDFSLSRDTLEYSRRKRLHGDKPPIPPLNFTWSRVL